MEFRHYFLGRQLIQQGNRVVIVSGSFSHLYRTPPRVDVPYVVESIDGITYCWVRVPSYQQPVSLGRLWNQVVFAWRLRSMPIDALPRPDAIVVSSPSLFPLPFARRWARRFASRLIFEVRDLWPLSLQELADLPVWHPLVLAMQLFESYGYRHAHSVVSLLPLARRHMESHGMRHDKFVYIPNGVDATERDSVPAAPPATRRDDTFTVGYVGTLGLANAVADLIDAARMLQDRPNIRFVIIGDGNRKAALEAASASLPAVEFLGSVPKEEVPSYLAGLDACYIGLMREPLFRFGVSPNKLFEYMYAAKPIIYAIDSGNRPVEDAACGISVPAGSPPDIAAAIRHLADLSDEERRQLGENGREYAMREHNYARLAERLATIL